MWRAIAEATRSQPRREEDRESYQTLGRQMLIVARLAFVASGRTTVDRKNDTHQKVQAKVPASKRNSTPVATGPGASAGMRWMAFFTSKSWAPRAAA